MRNLKTGAIQEKNFNASTKFDQANISKKAAPLPGLTCWKSNTWQGSPSIIKVNPVLK